MVRRVEQRMLLPPPSPRSPPFLPSLLPVLLRSAPQLQDQGQPLGGDHANPCSHIICAPNPPLPVLQHYSSRQKTCTFNQSKSNLVYLGSCLLLWDRFSGPEITLCFPKIPSMLGIACYLRIMSCHSIPVWVPYLSQSLSSSSSSSFLRFQFFLLRWLRMDSRDP